MNIKDKIDSIATEVFEDQMRDNPPAAADSRQPCEDEIISEPLRSLVLIEMGYDRRKNSCRTCVHRKTLDDKFLDRSWIEVCDLLRNSLGFVVIEETAWCRLWQGTPADVTPQAEKELPVEQRRAG